MALDAQIDLFKTQIADLQALVDKQKTQLATLSGAVSLLQQDNNKLYAKAMAFELVAKDEQAHYKEYLTHQHNPGTFLSMTKQGNFMYVFTTAPDTLNNRTSGPLPGK
jgi:peroxiredoxin family protein